MAKDFVENDFNSGELRTNSKPARVGENLTNEIEFC